MKYFDAHTHVYSDDVDRYPTIKEPTKPPGKTGTFAALQKLAQENDIARVCAIQPSSYYGWDNRFICDLSLAEPEMVAGVCTLNPEDPASASMVGDFKKRFGIRGIRSVPAADGSIDHPGVRDLWKACADNDLTVDVLTRHGNVEQLCKMLEELPDVRCVFDHCLFLAPGPDEEKTLAAILRLAQFPNAHAKVSFMPLNGTGDFPFIALHGPCREIIAAYTSSRCLWGSNFPCELWSQRSTYWQNIELFRSVLGLDQKTQEDIFWNTSSRLWFDGK